MRARDFEGWILARADGTFTAVCPTYPDGYHPDAVVVEAIPEGSMPMAPSSAGAAPPARSQDVDPTDEACCAA